MPTILLTNDDGLESPALLPLAHALSGLGIVRIVVPESERSWIGKAVSRFEPVRVRRLRREGHDLHAVSGTPADCVSLAHSQLFADQPDLVVSGINLGLNFGTAFLLSSGTVGAATEAWITGVPGVAFSMAIPADAFGLRGAHRAALLGPRCLRAAAVAATIVCTLLQRGFPADVDLFSVNMPAEVDPATPRRVTRVTRARYGPLFVPDAEGSYRHSFQWYEPIESDPTGDIETVRRQEISIAPVRLDFSVGISDPLRAALETPIVDGAPDHGQS